ncbi:hypothetical protein [Nitrosococcus wardiae]|uniref:Uncharacterized protein n=1 Tax=Nitrosococcus wardiae TaxID=1814290 RepID=A0A4P7BZJ6_9GAMM|nr:hypothetical protein [Nitrosococcus wardiae]QBQ55531.1 hypothetical protein E3U44_14195 [Nitrosococcus wardiae]
MDQSQTRRQVYVRNFDNDLAHSNREGIDRVWLERHKEYFNDKNLIRLGDSREATGNDQGIDMLVYSPKLGKSYRIEHKEHLNTEYEDDIVHIEYKQIAENGKITPGWIADDSKQTDIFAYHKEITGITYYWNWQELRQFWWYLTVNEAQGEYKSSRSWNGWGYTYCLQIPASDITDIIEFMSSNAT